MTITNLKPAIFRYLLRWWCVNRQALLSTVSKMARRLRQLKALSVLTFDLFEAEDLATPPPATLSRRRLAEITLRQMPTGKPEISEHQVLPKLDQLQQMYQYYNWKYFDGKLPRTNIVYSNRMTSAGSYTPSRKLITIGRKYHEIFPDELADTLKHEMIHIRHIRHDTAFKAEAKRVGASVRANSHPLLRRPPRYIYLCGNCGGEYPRQKRLVMASCGECSSGRKFDPRYKLILKKDRSGKEKKVARQS